MVGSSKHNELLHTLYSNLPFCLLVVITDVGTGCTILNCLFVSMPWNINIQIKLKSKSLLFPPDIIKNLRNMLRLILDKNTNLFGIDWQLDKILTNISNLRHKISRITIFILIYCDTHSSSHIAIILLKI